ncbi:MAG: ATP-dependent nuclease [Anaerorhabdus sp.]
MRLIKFRVKDYKTIEDTNWLTIDDISCLVGVNESGKTNVITALLKLNSADSEIKVNPMLDYPRSKFSQDREILDNKYFVEACFESETPIFTKKEIIKNELNEEGHTIEVKETIEEEWKYLKYRRYYSNKLECYVSNNLDNLDAEENWTHINNKNDDLPVFIYYASYANLDAELHLPTIITNVDKYDSLSEKTKNKVKTMKILFDYINLTPQKILELGRENSPGNAKTEAIINVEKEKKKEREILLDSAATDLTKNFKQWWKQGNYNFDFSVDGDYFRIWVRDEIRPDKIELESRSSGLQWFFSFYLIFMSETKNKHKNAILLLDEPGHTLHPMAQKDLSLFFNELSKNNQLIYTTHSPFLVDSMNITQTKVVYFDNDGITKISDDLQINKTFAKKSIYPINSAIGITVSDTMLIGCKPIIVEGVSDQIYLTYIKRYLMKNENFISTEELVFMPVDGTKNIKPVVSLITGNSDELPFVIIDNDVSGKEKEKSLKKNLYATEESKILNINNFMISETEDAEIEDFMNKIEIAESFNREFRLEEEFEYDNKNKESIIKQIEKHCKENEYKLPQGWKVLIARRYIQRNIRIDNETVEKWKELFEFIK